MDPNSESNKLQLEIESFNKSMTQALVDVERGLRLDQHDKISKILKMILRSIKNMLDLIDNSDINAIMQELDIFNSINALKETSSAQYHEEPIFYITRLKYIKSSIDFLEFIFFYSYTQNQNIYINANYVDNHKRPIKMISSCHGSFSFAPAIYQLIDAANPYSQVVSMLMRLTPQDKQKFCLTAFNQDHAEINEDVIMPLFKESIGDNLWDGGALAKIFALVNQFRSESQHLTPLSLPEPTLTEGKKQRMR